jgi:serine/threonine-protein kinase
MEFRLDTRYEVVREIARGGMGNVYEAYQRGVDGFAKRVALKVLREDKSADRDFVEAFVHEAMLAADLVHENIVQIYQLGKHEGRHYIAMELCDGVTLRRFCHRHVELGRKVPCEIAAFVASRVCRALEYAHTKRDRDGNPLGIVHRDICPQNILLTFGGVAKLGDFGIAKGLVQRDREGEILLGKARYMSPEQASYGDTDARSDIFSLGVVLYEMLAGGPLFEGEATTKVLEAVALAAVPPLLARRPDCPIPLASIVERALARDRDQRWPEAGELGYALEWHLYHKGYGPTNLTLKQHLAELFPDESARAAAMLDFEHTERARTRAALLESTQRVAAPRPPECGSAAGAGADSDTASDAA